jgi:hypothetical protein
MSNAKHYTPDTMVMMDLSLSSEYLVPPAHLLRYGPKKSSRVTAAKEFTPDDTVLQSE